MTELVEPAAERPAPRSRTLALTYARPGQSRFRRGLIALVETVSGRVVLERLYRDWLAEPPDPREAVFSAAIRKMRVRTEVVAGDVGQIPRTGPLLVLANHPFGIVDGLLVGHLVATVRQDMKIMTHSLLCQPEEAREVLLPVDFGTGAEARRTTLDTRRRAAEWLDQGHVLIVFPAGSVSTAVTPFARHAHDAAWHPFVVRLAQRRGVRTVVMFLHGQNSRLFQIASHLSYPIRVALILRETAARVGARARVSVSAPIEAADLPKVADRAAVAEELRRICYGLAGRGGPDPARMFVWPRWIRW